MMTRKTLIQVAAVAVLALPAAPVLAVDVFNTDTVPRDVLVNDGDGGTRVVTVAPRERLTRVCETCSIVLNDLSAEASGDAIVEISNGKLAVKTK